MKCPYCQGEKFTEGRLSLPVLFVPIGVLNWLGINQTYISVVRCDTCGHLSLFTDIPKGKK